MSAEVLHTRIDHDLTNHAPADEAVIERFEAIRGCAKALGHQLVELCPEGRELSMALTNLEGTVMYAVAAIARAQDRLPDPATK